TGCDVARKRPPMTPEQFQSTHPIRDATAEVKERSKGLCISIHASHTGCDSMSWILIFSFESFQSTHPIRDATFASAASVPVDAISIHASHTGCDYICQHKRMVLVLFQ